MKKNIILSVVCGMVAMASLTSCNDFLQVSATNQKEMDKSFTTYDELRLATAYLYMKSLVWFSQYPSVCDGRCTRKQYLW